MAMRKGLGKGLGALIGDYNEQPDAPSEGAVTLPLQKIEPNPLQPRKTFNPEELDSLADSIRMHGIIQPLTVRRLPSGFYQIIALALIENLQRSDLNPIEEALGYQELMGTYEMTQEQAAARVGKSRPAVANALRLLSLSPAVLELVKDGSLSAGHARALLPVKDEAQQLSIAQKVMALGLSVRQTEALCKKLTKQAQPVKEQPPQVDYLAECEKELTAGLGRKVRIVSGKRKGRIELEYYGQDDLQQLYDALHTIRKKEQH